MSVCTCLCVHVYMFVCACVILCEGSPVPLSTHLSLRLTVYPLFSLSLLSPLIVVDETILRFPLQNFLELEELNTPSPSPSPSSSSSPSPAAAMMRLDGVALSWSADGDKKVISGVSFTVDEVRVHPHTQCW